MKTLDDYIDEDYKKEALQTISSGVLKNEITRNKKRTRR